MIKDEEDFMESVISYVKANLNTKITAINTEKGDFTIDTITADSDHYVICENLLDLPNRQFVNFFISNIDVQNIHGNIRSEITMFVDVAFDNPKNQNVYLKSLRYMRALYECLQDFEISTNEIDALQITKAKPMVVSNNRRELVISGIEIIAVIG